jgi:hypothetical protein
MNTFDPACLHISTAIRAIWLLWRRAAWKQLNDLGLSQADIDKQFTDFDEREIPEGQQRLNDNDQAIELINAVSADLRDKMLSAAVVMVAMYSAIYREAQEYANISQKNGRHRPRRRNRRTRKAG